ncbi:MAG: hypothetical protein ACI4VQ_08250 [Clostridia bacterium]
MATMEMALGQEAQKAMDGMAMELVILVVIILVSNQKAKKIMDGMAMEEKLTEQKTMEIMDMVLMAMEQEQMAHEVMEP